MDADALRTELAWIRRIARALTRDPVEAEDVAQDVALASLRRPPRSDGDRRPWLFRVAENALRMQRRSARRRLSREERAEAAPSLAGPAESAERLDVFRRLAEELAALPEPYRGTLLARYYENRSAVEIARDEGIAPETVRWRSHEGLRRLRARLDDVRPGWAVVVAPAIRRSSAPAAGTASVLVLLGAVALVGVVAWWASEPGPPVAAPVAARPAPPPPSPAEPPPPREGEVAAPARLVAEAPSDPKAPAPAVPPAEPVPPERSGLALRVVDERGTPLPRVTLHFDRGNPFDVAAPETPRAMNGDGQWDAITTLATDADGRILLPFAPGRERAAGTVIVTAPDRTQHRTTFRRTHDVVDLGTFTLRPAGSVKGALDGDPDSLRSIVALAVADRGPATEAFDFPPSLARAVEVTADGAFRFDHVAPGVYRLLVRRAGALVEDHRLVTVEPGAVTEVADLPVREGSRASIQGRLVGADLAPRAGFFVSLLANDDPDALQSESFTQTDGDGRFRLQTLGPGPYAVNAWMGSERASARSVSPGDELLLVLREPLRVPVRLEPAGAYALGGAVRALRASDGVRLSNGGTEDGGERLFCDVPAEPFRVEVRAGGYAPGLSDVVDPTRLPDAVEVRLEPLGVVHGVVTHDGAPVAGAEVLAHDGATEAAGGDPFAARPARRLAAAPLDGRASLEPGIVTDEAGRFAFTVDHSGTLALLVTAPGLAPRVLRVDGFDGVEGTDALEVRLDAGGAVAGRAVAPPGVAPDGVVIGIAGSDGLVRTTRTSADGTFRFDHLAAGRHVLSERPVDRPLALHAFSGPASLEGAAAVDVREGDRVALSMPISGASECVVRGTVTIDGRPPERFNVGLHVGVEPRLVASAPVAEDGTFVLTAREPGPARLVITGMDDAAPITVVEDFSLRLGPTESRLDLSTGAVRSTPVQPPLAVVTVLGPRRFAFTPLLGDAVLVPAGAGFLTRSPFDPRTDRADSPTSEAAVDVPAGGSTKVDLR